MRWLTTYKRIAFQFIQCSVVTFLNKIRIIVITTITDNIMGMILETRIEKEFHANGNLMYETTFGVIYPEFKPAFKNVIENNKGELLVRIGTTKRYWNNGQINWQLNYNSDGSLAKEQPRQFRKDGTHIIY